jgi:uncharacterized protein involved in cysteine biosynthesis
MIRTYNLWSYVWIPLALSFVLGVFFFLFGIVFAYQVVHEPFQNFAERVFGEIQFVATFLEILIFFVLSVFLLLGTAFLYRPIVSIIMLPFLETLFSRLEKEIRSQPPIPTNFNPMMNFAGIFINLKYLFLELFVLFFSIFSGPVQPILLLFVQGYFLGRTSFDYIALEKANSLEEKNFLIRKFRMETWGLGVAQFLLMLIPVFGVLFSPLMGVIGSYLIYLEGENQG